MIQDIEFNFAFSGAKSLLSNTRLLYSLTDKTYRNKWYHTVSATFLNLRGLGFLLWWYPRNFAYKSYFVIHLALRLKPYQNVICKNSASATEFIWQTVLVCTAEIWALLLAFISIVAADLLWDGGSAKFLCWDLRQSSTELESSTCLYAYTRQEAPPGMAGFVMAERPGQGQWLLSWKKQNHVLHTNLNQL